MLARPAAEPLLVFLFSLLVTGVLVANVALAFARQDRLYFDYQVAQTLEAIQQRIAITSNLLRGTVGLFYTLLGHDRFGAVEWRKP